jgi:AraC-like DNA-binding protein
MARAAETLVLERKSVKETALALGYQDPHHFSRVFKAHFGLSPTQFVAAKLR